jgi:hypothetical protein
VQPRDDLAVPPRLRPVLGLLHDACGDDGRIRAAWIGGSLASGLADDWSDIDLHLAVRDPEEFEPTAWLGGLTPLVLADPIPGVPGGFLFLTPDWVHVDLVVHGTTDLDQGGRPARVLLDRDHLLREVPATGVGRGEPYYPADQVRQFLYFMGNAVTVLHRGELLALSQGTAVMRDQLLVPLLLAENGIRKQDGAKRLNRYLTSEQLEFLAGLPPISLDASELRAAQRAIAAGYLRRARRLASRCHALWPQELEQAALRLWRRELDLQL